MNHQMEIPKDYSCEDMAPVPATRATNKRLDGSFVQRRHRESSGIDPNELVYKLHNLSKEQHRAYAMDSLRQHYNSVFQNRRKPTYKVYITYHNNEPNNQNLTYLVRVERNTLREVKKKLPMKGSFRFFFIRNADEAEEVEDEELELPFHEKEGSFSVYCRVFPK